MSEYSILSRVKAWKDLIGGLIVSKRDLYKVFGYKPEVTHTDMLEKYKRQDIAGRIVEAEPRATWSNPPHIKVGEALPGEHDIAKMFDRLNKRLKLYNVLNRLDKLAGLGHYSILVVGINDGKKLSDPLNTSRQFTENDLLYLQPYSSHSAEIIEYVQDQNNSRFNQPEMYRINPANNILKSQKGGHSVKPIHNMAFNVHWSRVIHVCENNLEDEIVGNPRLERVYNLLDDTLKTVGGSAETFWLTANRGLQVDVDKDMDLSEADAEALSEEIDEYQDNLRRVMRTRGVKINSLGSDVADPRGPFGVIMALISGATGIPQRILLGSEAGQLASAQDRANWANRLEERREVFIMPMILQPLVDMMQKLGIIATEEDIKFIWPDAFKQNPLERAQTSAQKARALANVSKALSSDVPVVSVDEGRHIIGVTGPAPMNETGEEDIDG